MKKGTRVFTIKKSELYGYEIISRYFHNIAPSVEVAVNYLKDRYGSDVVYRIKDSTVNK